MTGPHIIYRQILEISYPSKKGARLGQDQMSKYYREDLMPLMDEIFDMVDETGNHIRIDRLEIDLGRVSPQSLEEEIRSKLRSTLEEELFRHLQKTRVTVPFHEGDDAEISTRKPYYAGETHTKEVSVHSPSRSELELFAFFVRTGQLPWWTGRKQALSLEELAATLIENQPGRLLDLLLDLIPAGSCTRRIIYQFPDDILRRFIELKKRNTGAGKQIQNLHEDFYELQMHQRITQLNRSSFRQLLWQCAFNYWFLTGDSHLSILKPNTPGNPVKVSPGETETGARLAFSSLVSGNDMRSYLLYVVKALAERGISGGADGGSPVIKTIQLLLRRIVDIGIQNKQIGKIMTALGDLPTAKIEDTLSAELPAAIKKGEYENYTSESGEKLLFSESIEINNAGLVIIAPFLPRFFDSLGLISGKSFATGDAAGRAALILQYIVKGETEMAEHDLILNKLLCGLPAAEPIARELDLSEPDREEVKNLLQSVIEHWEALKGTSADGFRETFLVKEGLLDKEVNGWRLRVERTTVDVLLDRLPWSISIIKLPWNDEMIHVEW